MLDRKRLQRLAVRLAKGRPIAWDDEERLAAGEEERAAVRELRVLAAMSAFNEMVQSGDEARDLGSSISIARSVVAGEAGGEPSAGAAPSLPRGARWGHLEILESIGRGAFGEVYRARDTRLDRVVALKILANEAPVAGNEVVREARLMARVRHPNVVTVHGADRIDGRVGIWMEFLRGETLQRLLKQRGPLDAREAALIGIDLCRALSAVHAAGIAHRDVKLANVMRAEGGRIVLMDFGLGHEIPRGGSGPSRKPSGTPLFMAPEVLRGEVENARSDIYSLGVVLFTLVTGKLPVEASSLSGLLARHERRESRRARDLRPDLPESFAHVLERALDPDPRSRHQSAGEIERALLQSLGATVLTPASENHRRVRRWIVPALGSVVLVVLAAAAIVRWARPPNPAASSAPRAPFASVPDQMIVGEGPEGLFGLTVAGVGDFDQDGFDDVAVAAPLLSDAAPEAGKVYLYRGGRAGLDPKPAWTFALPETGLYLGYAIAPFANFGIGGFPDLVIGAPGSGETKLGQVLIFPGSRNGSALKPAQILRASMRGTGFGIGLSAGDVNHDGSHDLLLGEPGYPPKKSGRALLYLSRGDSLEVSPAWTFTGPESSLFGWSVALGDLNNDGYGDAVIGAPRANFGAGGEGGGAAYVFLGSANGLSSTPIVLHGRQPGALCGQKVFLAGDVDGDRFQDLFVGSEEGSNGEEREGIGEIYFGSPTGVSPYGAVLIEPNVTRSTFGGHGGPLGDVDGDGCDDFWVGAPRYQRAEPRAGAAFVFSGSRRRVSQRSWFRVGAKGGTWYGGGGSAAGDIDGDGLPDFVVAGSSWDTQTGQNTGMIEVFLNTRRRR